MDSISLSRSIGYAENHGLLSQDLAECLWEIAKEDISTNSKLKAIWLEKVREEADKDGFKDENGWEKIESTPRVDRILSVAETIDSIVEIWNELNARYQRDGHPSKVSPHIISGDAAFRYGRMDLMKWFQTQSKMDVVHIIYPGMDPKRVRIPTRSSALYDVRAELGIVPPDPNVIKRLLRERIEVPEGYLKDLVAPEHDPEDMFLRSKALVIAGEAGAGKSVYGCVTLPQMTDAAVLRAQVTEDAIGESQRPELVETKECCLFLRTVMRTMVNMAVAAGAGLEGIACDSFYSELQAAWNRLHPQRTRWAMKVANNLVANAIDVAVDSEERRARKLLESWKHRPTDCPLGRIVLVFDNAGMNMEFVHAMIDNAPAFLAEQRTRLGCDVGLVLCGAHMSRETSPVKCMKSDPSLSEIISPGRPDLSKLDSLWPCQDAIEKGVYSRILATNTRMLCRGIRPVLMSDLVVGDPDQGYGISVKERQAAFGSHCMSMERSVRTYSKLSGGGCVPEDFLKCFQCMHVNSLKDIQSCCISWLGYKEVLKRYETKVSESKERSSDIKTADFLLKLGILTQNASPAIMLVACGGFDPVVRAGSGAKTFESMLAAHLSRMYQCWGYAVHRYELQAAWSPPLGHELDPTALLVDIHAISTMLKGTKGKIAVILQQGRKNFYGPDVMVVAKTGDEGPLEFKAFSTVQVQFSEKVALKAARSLGIGVDGKKAAVRRQGGGRASEETEAKSARRSGSGLQLLQDEVEKRAPRNAKAEWDRIVVSSQPLANFPAESESDWDFAVWSREILEPSITLWDFIREKRPEEYAQSY